jgi:hypothetical protein
MSLGDREVGFYGLGLGDAVGSDAGQPTWRLGRGGQIDLGRWARCSLYTKYTQMQNSLDVYIYIYIYIDFVACCLTLGG